MTERGRGGYLRSDVNRIAPEHVIRQHFHTPNVNGGRRSGTHPTGMQSCWFKLIFIFYVYRPRIEASKRFVFTGVCHWICLGGGGGEGSVQQQITLEQVTVPPSLPLFFSLARTRWQHFLDSLHPSPWTSWQQLPLGPPPPHWDQITTSPSPTLYQVTRSPSVPPSPRYQVITPNLGPGDNSSISTILP